MTTVSDTPPLSPPLAAPFASVDRAVAELRRGSAVVIGGAGNPLIVAAVETLSPASFARLRAMAGERLRLIVTAKRAAALGLGHWDDDVRAVALSSSAPLTLDQILAVADPTVETRRALASLATEIVAPGCKSEAAILLSKLARLLPACLTAAVDAKTPGIKGLARVPAAKIARYDLTAATSLVAVTQARVPLAGAENAKIIAFRPKDGGQEHLAIVIGEPDPAKPVLIRLHSECFTGDLLGSLRCDCGEQLKGAIAEIHQAGSGILLYLAQEGRGIGLVNKLRAYRLQDDGFDTLDANRQIGYDDDERLYQPAIRMLGQMGISQVRLMTNNPAKVEALARGGITVVERVPHVFPANDHNAFYLSTKSGRGGHLF